MPASNDARTRPSTATLSTPAATVGSSNVPRTRRFRRQHQPEPSNQNTAAITRLRLVELVARAEPRPQARYTVRVGEVAIEVDDAFDDDVLRRLISVVASC